MRKIEITAHSEKEYIFSGQETLSYGLKRKKHKKEKQEAKKEAQERSTTQIPNHCLRRKLYPAEEKTPTYTQALQQGKYITHGYSVSFSPGVKSNHRPHSTLSAKAQIPKFQGQIQGVSTCYYNPLTNYPAFSVKSHI